MMAVNSGNRVKPRPPLLAIALLSCSALAYEILLTRLFAMIHWHNLAALVISLALLGYGASGTFLSLARRHLSDLFEPAFVINALLFAISSVAAFQLAGRQPLNPMELAWNPWQLWNLGKIYLLLAFPFFAVANCIGLALWHYRESVSRVYASDLLGAGAGALMAIGLLYLQPPFEALLTLAVTGALAGALASLSFNRRRVAMLGSLLVMTGLLLSPGQWREVPPSEYKDLAYALSARGAAITRQASNPLGVMTVLENREVSYRYAPGLSIAAPVVPPALPALFINGDLAGGLHRHDTPDDHLGHLSSALPYSLLDSPRVLVNGAGGGIATAQALALGAGSVNVIETNSLLLRLLDEGFGQATVRVRTENTSLRQHLASSERRYELIQWSLVDGLGEQAGLQAHRENYHYTREAFADALARLAPGGLLAVTRGLRLPPRGSLRMMALAIDALVNRGLEQPGMHLAMIRSWNTATLLVSLEPFTTGQLQRIRGFCRQRSFDLVWLPGIRAEELNRHHKLKRPMLYQGVVELLGAGRERFIARYPFRIDPPTDNRPYFDHFTRTENIRELLRQPAGTGLGHLDWGYALLWVSLLLAVLSSLLLILLPLAMQRKEKTGANGTQRSRVLLFFAAIGLAFLFVEIAFIQHLQLFLGDPIYAIAVVLGGFLVSAGIGSRLSGSLEARLGGRRTLAIALGAIILFALLQLLTLETLFGQLAQLELGSRIGLCLLLIVPLGVVMGMPFPLGLSRLGRTAPQLIPWAWGINGCASVISAIASTLLSMWIGFSGVLLLACGCYLLAFVSFPRESLNGKTRQCSCASSPVAGKMAIW